MLPAPRALRALLLSSSLALSSISLAQIQAAPTPDWTQNVRALGALSVADNGDVVFIGSDAKLRRLNSDGQEQWAFALGDVGRAQPILTPQGLTIAVAYDDTVYAIDAGGKKLWSVRLDGDLYASPALRQDGSIIVASSTGSVYAFSAAGAQLWQTRVGAPIYSSPAIAPDGSIYLGTQGNALVALDAAGQLKWSFRTGSTVFGSPALDTAGNIYFGSGDKSIYSLTPQGKLRWTRRTASFVNASPIVTSGNLVVVGSYDGNLYALTTAGQDAWVYPAGAPIAAPAAELMGEIVVGDLSGTLHAVGPDGKALWRLQLGERIDTSVNVSLAGTLYLATASGKLRAFAGQPPLADGPWTVYRNVASGLGRALSTIEAASLTALKRPAAQRALAGQQAAALDAQQPANQTQASTQQTNQSSATRPPLAQAQGIKIPTLPPKLPPTPAMIAQAAAAQARSDHNQIVLPISVLGALGATITVQTPISVTIRLGRDLSTLPLRYLGSGTRRGIWLALADLEKIKVGGAAATGRYDASARQYVLDLGGKPALTLKLDFPALLSLQPGKEFPDVIERPAP